MPDQEQDQQISLDEWERRTFERYGVPENLRRSILGQESADGTKLKSPTGVRGRYQVTQDTAQQYGLDRDDQWQQPVAAAKHLRTLYDGVKKRNPGFSDKQVWLGSAAEYYYGSDAFDKDGNLSQLSRDGYSNPAKYATSIAERWSAFDREETPQPTAPALSTARQSGTVAYPPQRLDSKYGADYTRAFEVNYSNEQEQYDERGRKKIGSRDLGLTPAEGMNFDLSGGASKTPPSAPPQVSKGQRKLWSVGPRVQPPPPESSPFAPKTVQEIAAGVGRRSAGRAAMIGPETNERLRKIEEFEAQPLATQIGQQVKTYLASGGAELSRLTRRAVCAGVGAAQALQGGKLENVDVRPEAFKQWEEARQRELVEEKQRYRPTLANEIAQGIVEGAPVAAAAGIAGAATGGGALATIGTGAGLSAVGADWNDPARAAAQTVLGGVAPYAGGKLGSAVAGSVAGRLASPAAQIAARVAGEIGGGAAGNVLQSGAEQLGFEGQISPRELAKQAIVGGALSAPGALMVGRPSLAERIRARLESPSASSPGQTIPDARTVAPLPVPPQITRRAEDVTTQETPLEAPGVRPVGPVADTRTVEGITRQQPEVETIIARAREAAERSGRPVEGRTWEAQERQIRESVGQAQTAEDRARLIEQRLAELEQGAPVAEAVTPRPKPQFVADAEQRLSDATSGRRAGSGAEQLFDQAIVVGWKAYKAGQDFATWSADVIKEAGERVRPHLERVWKELTESFSVGPLPRTREDVERSPQFQRFFRDSKVTDDQGKPLVVYHGTPSSFDTFDPAKIKQGGSLGPGVYIAENPYTANQYISGYNVKEDAGKSPNIMPLYLAMQKPLDVEAPALDRAEVARLIGEDAEYLPDSDKVSYFEVIDAVGDKQSQDVAKRLGYDGLVMNMPSGRVWLALDPTQIKSATGNQGTFDTSSGSILGSGFGSLQPLFEGRGKSSKPSPSAETLIEQMTAQDLRAELARTKQAAAGSRERLNKTVGKLERTSMLDTVAALRKAGLLTGVKTHLRNVGGTGVFQGVEEVSRIPAAIADLAISAVTGQRTITGASPRSILRSGQKAATEGLQEAAQILRRGASREDLERLQLDREIRSGSKVVDAYVNGVFRLLSAEDAVFRKFAYTRSLQDRAKAQALTEARQGAINRGDAIRRMMELAKNPPEAMAADAILDAEVATFNNENLISRGLGAARTELRKTRAGRTANFAIDLVAPFTKTPSNIIARMLEYSPVGYAGNAVQMGRRLPTKPSRQSNSAPSRKLSGALRPGHRSFCSVTNWAWRA